MFSSTDLYVDVLCKLNITANQFLLCHLLYQDYQEQSKSAKAKTAVTNLYKYVNDKNRAFTTKEIDDLVDKDFLVDKSSRKTRQSDMLEVTDTFIKKVYASVGRFKEFWEVYPRTAPAFDGSGNHIKLKVCDPDELEAIYLKLVKTNKLHDEIIDLVRWAERNNQLNIGIKKFVQARYWESLRDLRKTYADDNMRIAR